MINYKEEITDILKGNTDKEKYDYLICATELFEEMVGLHSKKYDDEECGVHFKEIFKKLSNQHEINY